MILKKKALAISD